MSEIAVARAGHVETWTIRGQARRNTLTLRLVDALAREVARVNSLHPEVRCVVITGEGEQAFCAGADLKERLAMDTPAIHSFLDRLGQLFRSLETSPVVYLAHLNGAALGGGLELALACDLRTAAPHTQLALSEVALGIIPGAGGTVRLPRLVGSAIARALILTARRMDATRALGCGLLESIGDLSAAEALAAHIAGLAPLALAAAKSAIDGAFHATLEQSLAHERRCYEPLLPTADRREGLDAFAGKRAPRYFGR